MRGDGASVNGVVIGRALGPVSSFTSAPPPATGRGRTFAARAAITPPGRHHEFQRIILASETSWDQDALRGCGIFPLS